jgi:hypothetical protein
MKGQALYLPITTLEKNTSMKCGSIQGTTTTPPSGSDASPQGPTWTKDLVLTDELVDAFLKVAAALKAKKAAA